MTTTASVIIATYNRADLLDECLRHLARQSFARGDEVLIADNGSTDRTAAIVSKYARSFPVPLSRIFVPTPGKSHAVAAALQVASGDVVALTDDDVSVADDWLVQLKQAFTSGDVALVGGPVEPRWEKPAPGWLHIPSRRRLGAPLGLLDYGDSELLLGPRTLLGANMAVRRSVLQQLGGYATHLGKLRGTLLSGEDHELCERIQAAGYHARYVPSIRVRHWVPSERTRLAYLVRWFFWSGITKAAMENDAARRKTLFGLPAHVFRQFADGMLRAIGCALAGQLAPAVDRALDSAFAAGYAAKRWGLVRAAAPTTQAMAGSV